eukprot:CAMPEP_0195511968 /NCGR_PEP_ID=MMETSP0794_2-20130614/4103_1 /TAXON_ID=515487 /ORGANISM="Stephanopyxis turris, Strain CCMP 815" /LENGTH=597 /DNA_ID=CAMNT_0040639673 /DNA_START=80 /DNA_END=1873 /DNA_ORIENTATION=+
MRRFRPSSTILHAFLALCVLELIIDDWNINNENDIIDRDLTAEEELADVLQLSKDRRLVELANFELMAGGYCTDSEGRTYDNALFLMSSVDDCANHCETFDECVGFDSVSNTLMCYIYFSDGDRPATVPGSVLVGEGTGEGDIVGTDGNNNIASCFFRRRTADDGTVHLDNYDNLGDGYCLDSSASKYSKLAYHLGSAANTEDCAEKCDGFPLNQGFVWQPTDWLCMCQFNPDDLPYDVSDPDSLGAIPGASTVVGLSTQQEGECEVDSADGTKGYECYANKNALTCDAVETAAALAGGVSGDPLFMGLHGQAFKFDGRSGAWYANVATSKLQWNLRFGEFETCPEDENMFVTATTMTLFKTRSLPFQEPQIAHTIKIEVIDEDKFFPGCESGVCLGEGSLMITIDGKTNITAPGDYELEDSGGRIVAHNTFAPCSRKWYDFVPHLSVGEDEDRRLDKKMPLDYMNDDRGQMLDPRKCTNWMRLRARDGDLFAQEGGWSTIHIDTPNIGFHVEYRQDKINCRSHTLDSWISEVTPVLLQEDWKGILGETRMPSFYPNGEQVTSEREYLLSRKDDKDYEVDGAFGVNFPARYSAPGAQ